jgi:peroxiredoxin Q/BCP
VSGPLIRKFDVAYFMASVDTPEDNKAFAEKEHADFPLLSDPGKKVASAYGVVNDQRPLAFRWTFYIGPDGKIVYIDKQVKAGTSGEDVVAKLKELNVPERR